jgi:hypothetical protein
VLAGQKQWARSSEVPMASHATKDLAAHAVLETANVLLTVVGSP